MEVKWVVIVVAAVILAFLFGWFLSRILDKKSYDGKLVIVREDDRDQFQFIFDTELEDLVKKSELNMKIEHSQ